jgi:cysteinyl-tRNA synthetase
MMAKSSSSQKDILLYNTASRSLERLDWSEYRPVTIYTCGPTVYGEQHIGNYRTFVFEDVLVRLLKFLGIPLQRVMNITDVGHLTSDADSGEDKLEVGAQRDGITAWEVAKRYTEHFEADMRLLGVVWPDALVRATDTIDAQIGLIKALEEKGYTYIITDGVYFDTAKYPQYRDFAKLDVAGLDAGSRVEMGEKRNITDFALWKFSTEPGKRHMEWESPWGLGFPGWHIECSAIIKETLGNTIDIHCGGVDHIQVHHTNEVAQSEAAHGEILARIWMHGEFLLVDGGKMSKSLGNIYTLANLKAKGITAPAFRLFLARAHYRSKLNFTWEEAQIAQKQYDTLAAKALESAPQQSDIADQYIARAVAALAHDLNTAQVLAIGLEASKELEGGARTYALETIFTTLLGIHFSPGEVEEIPEQVQELARLRDQAREKGDWSTADTLRTKIESYGYDILDTKNESRIVKKVL